MTKRHAGKHLVGRFAFEGFGKTSSGLGHEHSLRWALSTLSQCPLSPGQTNMRQQQHPAKRPALLNDRACRKIFMSHLRYRTYISVMAHLSALQAFGIYTGCKWLYLIDSGRS